MPTAEETKRYFDAHATRLAVDRLVDKSGALREVFFDRLAPASRVVEVGAGTGLYTRVLLAAGHEVTAVDLSQACLDQINVSAQAMGTSTRLRTVRGDFMEIAPTLGRETFDAVSFVKVLHHFPDKASIRAALAVAYDLLVGGGRIYVFEPNGDQPLWPLALLLRGYSYWQNERNVLLIRRAFLTDVAAELPGASCSVGYRYVIPGGLSSRIPGLVSIDRQLCRLPSRLLNRLAVNIALEITKPLNSPN
jgi:SAM-dependent methyltransferase